MHFGAEYDRHCVHASVKKKRLRSEDRQPWSAFCKENKGCREARIIREGGVLGSVQYMELNFTLIVTSFDMNGI